MIKKNNKTNKNAFLIPGGGLDSRGIPNSWVVDRLRRLLDVVNDDDLVILLSRYTIHKPPILDRNGMPISECKAAADYLIRRGFPVENIRIEDVSYDTIGNIYFAKTLFIEPMGINTVTIINSEFHMPRTKVIAEWIFNLQESHPMNLRFISVPNSGLSARGLERRIEQEQLKIKKLEALKDFIHTKEAFHNWLFTEHEAYSVQNKPTRYKEKLILNSY